MNLKLATLLIAACAITAFAADEKKPAAPVAETSITDNQRIEFLKARATLAEYRGQIIQAQGQADQMQRTLQTQIDAMVKTCKPDQQFDAENLACKVPEKAAAAPVSKK